MPRRPPALATVMLAVALLIAPIAPGAPGAPAFAAQDEQADQDEQAAEGEPAGVDPEELQAFVDAFFTAAVVEEPVPGAAVVAVQGDERIVSSGYGVAEAGTTRDVDDRRTVFSAGSVVQVVTAIAALQLVERGVLDLTSDVNRWLSGVTVPDTYPEPVTLADLLTHSAGLDGTIAGTLEQTQAEVVPLGTYLATAPPHRVEAPGQVIRSTPQAPTLTGLLIEQQSHRRFGQYVATNVFAPLRMRSTGITLGDGYDVATGHHVRDGGLEAAPRGHHNTAPAASLFTTAYDMSALIHLLLSHGVRADGTQVLDPALGRRIVTPRFRNDSRLPGVSFGLYEHVENGERAWVQAGTELGFTSLLLLLPDHDLGLFVVYNSQYPPLRTNFVHAFFDEFFPGGGEVATRLPPGDLDLARYAGSYAPQHDTTTFLGLGGRLLDQETVTVEGDTIAFDGREWRPIAPDLFQALEDPDLHLAFGADPGGEIAYAFPEHGILADGTETLYRQPWSSTRTGFTIVMGGFALAFLVTLLATSWHRRRAKRRHAGLRALARGVAGANLGFLVAFPLAFAIAGRDLRFHYGIPPAFPVLLTVPLVTLGLSILLVVLAGVAAVRGRLSPLALAWPLSVAALGIAFTVVAAGWNLVGPFGLGPFM